MTTITTEDDRGLCGCCVCGIISSVVVEPRSRSRSESLKGRAFSEERRRKISEGLKKWRSRRMTSLDDEEELGNGGLFQWVRDHLERPAFCQMCNQAPRPSELANITGVFNKAFENWAYLCTRCYCNEERWEDGWIRMNDDDSTDGSGLGLTRFSVSGSNQDLRAF